uniref:C2H2-type domain-containing protein n=1 Tax=Stomoxys calcitrans TaxID=35570 RepID=A0A1I8P3K6_STOCA
MLNMEWEKRLQYICGKCWQHIWEFHQFQESIIEAQNGLHLQAEAAGEVDEVKLKSELNINQQELHLDWHNVKELSDSSTEDSINPTALNFDIKTEEPLDINSDQEGMSPQDGQHHLTDEEVPLMMSSRKDNDDYVVSNEDYSSSDDLPLSSLGQTNLCSSDKKVLATKRSVEEFDELVALWRSSLECEICHQLVASYSQLKEHFSKNHASEGCYLMCCQLRLDTRYDIDRHIRYHNAPQQLKCVACCKAYRLEEHLRKHKRKVHTSKGGDRNAKDSKKLVGKYHCCKCSKDFATEKQLDRHNREVHKPKIFECNFCEKSFMRSDALREHLAGHRGERKHVCSYCPKAFTWRSNFSLHMRKSHIQEWKKLQDEEAQRKLKCRYRRETRGNCMVYVCIYCFKEYDSRFSMYYHAKRCQIYKAPIEYEKRHSLNHHKNDGSLAEEQASVHSEPPVKLHNTEGLSASTEDSITPIALNFDIKSEEPLDLNSGDGEMSPQDGQDHLTDEEKSLMMCESTSLNNDAVSNESKVSVTKSLECNFCARSFRRPGILREHLASHKGEKIHACSFCPKAFTWRNNFCYHMSKSHPKEWKKLQNEAAQRDTLKEYRRLARGNSMVYVCSYCSVEYDKLPSMNIHIRRCRIDGGTKEQRKMEFRLETRGESMVYICIYCSKEYEKRLSMQNHIRRWHRPVDHKKGYWREVRGESIAYVCSYCSKEYEKRYSIYQHIERCHGSNRPIESKKGYRRETRGESMVHVCMFCSKEYPKLQSMRSHLYRIHREEAYLARQAPMAASQDLLNNRIIGSNTNDVDNMAPNVNTLNEFGKEGEEEEDLLMALIEEKELISVESATKDNVKTEQFSAETNSLENEEMNEKDLPQELEDSTWESEEFLKSEEEFIEL